MMGNNQDETNQKNGNKNVGNGEDGCLMIFLSIAAIVLLRIQKMTFYLVNNLYYVVSLLTI